MILSACNGTVRGNLVVISRAALFACLLQRTQIHVWPRGKGLVPELHHPAQKSAEAFLEISWVQESAFSVCSLGLADGFLPIALIAWPREGLHCHEFILDVADQNSPPTEASRAVTFWPSGAEGQPLGAQMLQRCVTSSDLFRP